MNEKHKLMGTGNMMKLIIKFSLPGMLGMFINSLYTVVDRIFIGKIPEVGHFAMTGVGLTMPVAIISFAFAMLFGMGGSTLISLRLGEKKKETAEKYLGNATTLGFLSGVLLTILTLIFINPIVTFLGGSENTFEIAKTFLIVLSFGFPFVISGYALTSAIRSDGNPKMAMGTMLVGAVTNIILDPIFIFTFKMGVQGAAIATVISQVAAMVWALSYFLSHRSGLKFHLDNLKIKGNLAFQIFRQGMAGGLLQIGQSLVFYVLNSTLKSTPGGDYAVGAMTIVMTINMFFVMPMMGINQAVLPLAGYNYGAKLYGRVRGIFKRAIWSSCTIGTVGFLGVMFLGKYFIFLFTKNPELIEKSTVGLKIACLMFPIIGVQIVSSIYFQAIGKPKITMFLSLSRQIIFLIPLVIILGKLYGELGIWIAMPLSDLISTALTGYMVSREMKHLKHLEKQEVSLQQN